MQSQYDKAKQRALLPPGDSASLANPYGANASATRQPFTSGPPPGTPLRSSSTMGLSNQNRIHLGWGAHLSAGQGGGAGVPLAQNPGNSAVRPRRPLMEQQLQGQQLGGVAFGAGMGSFGGGGGGGIAPMPRKISGTGAGSGSSSGAGSGGAGGGGGGQQQMPEYLGQQSGSARRGGEFSMRSAWRHGSITLTLVIIQDTSTGDSAPRPSPMAKVVQPRSAVTPVRSTFASPISPSGSPRSRACVPLAWTRFVSFDVLQLPPARSVGGETESRELFWDGSKSAPSFWAGEG